MMVSLDGFFEGKDHDLSWHNTDEEFNQFAIDQIGEVDALIFGRKTYDLMAGYWPSSEAVKDDPQVANLMNTLPKIVFSKTLKEVEWSNTRLIKDNDEEEIIKLKKEKGKDIAIFGSNNLSVNLIKLGLIDEFRIMLNPVVLGDGNRLFKGIEYKLNLKLVKTREFKNGNSLLCYQPK